MKRAKSRVGRVVLAAAAWAGMAASGMVVPQDSASKYYFTTPVASNLIQGVVIGDPPAYRAMRYEDVAWLAEAEAEREALANGKDMNATGATHMTIRQVPQFGRWNLSETNRFSKWTTAVFLEGDDVVTNIVVGYNYKTNEPSAGVPRIWGISPSVRIGTEYLSNIDADWNSDEVYIETRNPDGQWPWETNVTETVTTNWNGGYWEDRLTWHASIKTNVSYITMPMTNGMQSVHTNMWTEIVPFEERIASTQVVQKTWLDLLFKDRKVHQYAYAGKQIGGKSGDLYRASGIKECYEALKGATRLAAGTHSGTGTTWRTWNARRRWILRDGEMYIEPWQESSGWISVGMSKIVYGEAYSYRWETPDGETGVDEGKEGYIDRNGPNGNVKYILHTLATPTNVFLAGGVDRIEKVVLYVGIGAEWAATDTTKENEYKARKILRKVGELEKGGTDESGRIYFSARINIESMLDDAMGETHSGFPAEGWTPQAPENGERTESYYAGVEEMIIVIHTRPWTRLQGW